MRAGARLGDLERLHHLRQPRGEGILCPNVRVHSFCQLEQAILMPGVRVGRHANPSGHHRSRRARAARRPHRVSTSRKIVAATVTDGGVVVVTADDEPLIAPIDEALRAEAVADRIGVTA